VEENYLSERINFRCSVHHLKEVKQVVEQEQFVECCRFVPDLHPKPSSELKLESARRLEAGMF